MAANVYARVEGKNPVVRGQAKMVWDAIVKLDKPVAVADVTPVLRATPGFSTVQTATRIAAYYVCVFHKSGALRVVGKTNGEDVSVVEPVATDEPVAAAPAIILTDSWKN